MRNYIILNGINSNTINGLLIQELPPISKPKMRTRTEEIDGRAGDIVTQLGFKAYDKTVEIGLYGNFDINEVISYFNSSGTVVFSNEPDKYYNYEILDQIDFQRLVRFRTAKVKMHCQPFKYPLEEEPLVAEYQLVTNTGSDMSLNNTANALFRKLDLKGNTSQTGTPTPSSPIPVNVVSGDNTIYVEGANILNNTDYTMGSIDNSTGQNITSSVNYRFNSYNEINGSKLYLTKHLVIVFYDNNKGWISYDGSDSLEINVPSNAKYFRARTFQSDLNTFNASDYKVYDIRNTYPIYLGVENSWKSSDALQGPYNANVYLLNTRIAWYGKQVVSGDTITVKCNNSNLQFTLGRTTMNTNNSSNVESQDTGWKTGEFTLTYNGSGYAFVGISKPSGNISVSELTDSDFEIAYNGNHISSTPIELCKIGTYQDYIYKEGTSWYLHKEIGKVVFDGSESYNSLGGSGSNPYYAFYNNNTLVSNSIANSTLYANYFITDNTTGLLQKDGGCRIANYNSVNRVFFCIHSITSVNDFKTWLSTHNTIVYYVLETPTTTEITDEDLIAQLEALKQANSYDGQTNISHEYNGSPFILDVAAVQKGTDILVINNEGNIYARPTLDIEGTGMVNVYLEGNQMFQVDLSENNEIVIDTDEMEAYDPSTQALMNRQVTGNYDNFKIVAGNNNLKFSGDLTKATVTNYERWL